MKDAKTFTILGEGDLRTADLLAALAKRQVFVLPGPRVRGEREDPMDDIRECLETVRKALPKS